MNALILLLALLLFSPQLHAAPDLVPQIATLLREQGLEGAVWTTLDAHGAAGASDAGSSNSSNRPMRVDHRVQVGSVAKTVLAAGLLRLVSQGRLGLDTPVSALLPGMAFDNQWEASDPVRIRHLLDHSAGLDDARLWQVFSMQPKADTPLAAAFPPGRGLLRVRHRPGTRFSYSNMGYTLLGMVIERIAGQPYERYLDAALLAPLGMHDSSFGFVTQAGDPGLAMGHVEYGVVHPALPSYLRPAGQFTTTAADMGRFARFLMGDGSIGGAPFIDPQLLRRMGEPHATEAARAGLQVGYGLGLRKLDRHGALAKCHSGNTIGFRAMLCLFPDTQQGFFIAINTDSETADYGRLDALLVRALQPAARLPAALPSPAFDSRAWEGFYIPAPNRFDSMRFIDTVANFLHVSREGNSLRLKPFQSAALELRHVGSGLFRVRDKLLASHVLLVSADGERIVTSGTQSYKKVPLIYLLSLWASVLAGVLGLAYVIVAGIARISLRRLSWQDPLAAPIAGVLALLLPLPFFYRQSFIQLGDLTLASGLLAAVTAALPVTMCIGLAIAQGRKAWRSVETAAMLTVLQCCLVLADWRMLPLRLWA
ncbi:serine hydrolase domain-containing protein [Telluria aromaticivorans]|uniref:Beta-lactamase family protein n=1 Tax=Telluria aromaticivorans TaxID=2725995 RepID=A0A7Y2NZY3_9BURK|nr:serine hydrolase domain-containing protein [Telluria aromaticivorans]NNG23559.1 beta-lactamase family protein [Telluria aromaticivorans]